jgi:hypothetical protein
MNDIPNVYKILVGKPDGMRLLGLPNGTLENNIHMHLKGIWSEIEDWINQINDGIRVASLPSRKLVSSFIKGKTFLEYLSDYKLLRRDSIPRVWLLRQRCGTMNLNGAANVNIT